MKTISIAILVTLIIAIPMVYGAVDWTLPYNNLNSGYRITTENFPDPVMIGDPVIAWAGTTNDKIDEVKFRWMAPDGSEIIEAGTFQGTVTLPDGKTVYQWSNTQYPGVLGDWGIQGVFYDLDEPGPGIGPIPDQPFKTEIRARSFFSIPEATIGTVTILLAMFASLGVFVLAKRKRAIRKLP